MSYVSLFTPDHVALLHDWLSELSELFIDLNYPHSGGSGRGYFVRSLEDIRNLMAQQTHSEIEITIFRAIIFPIRGTDHAVLLQRALQEIPESQYYQIVTPDPYPHAYENLADGKGHDELRQDVAKLDPSREIAIGVHPFDPPYKEFEQYYGASIERLHFQVRKSLNFYRKFSENPERYQAAIERWFGSHTPE